MTIMRFLKPLPLLGIVAGIAVVVFLSRNLWLPSPHRDPAAETSAATKEKDATGISDKIIVGDQAQKNLGITAKSLKSDAFWKSITVPGMVRDRAGVSDREIVSPAIGVVGKIYRTIGDTVRPGETLFTISLSSDALHETQADLFKTSQDIKLAQERLKLLNAAGDGIAKVRVIEGENEIKRLEATAKADRDLLANRGLSSADIDQIADGHLVNEISVAVPNAASPSERASTFEFQELKVEKGQQVQAGQVLCLLANHQLLSIEGRAFRDEVPLLEHSIKEQLPVEIDFQEIGSADWPAIDQTFAIQRIANVIDPATRTFTFLMPLENQSKAIERKDGSQQLWRFRPGQKVWLRVRTEKLDNVFVLPAEAVVREGADAFVFTQNVNTFDRKGVHVLFQDRERAVIANDGSLPVYRKNDAEWTIPAIVQGAAAQLNRMSKTGGSSSVPKGYHIHADGSLHKNEDEGK